VPDVVASAAWRLLDDPKLPDAHSVLAALTV
jgi:hypothetical protein